MKRVITAAYFLLFCFYAVFSFSLTDPNLVLTGWSPYWNFQQWMWQNFFSNRVLLTQVYTLLISLLFGCYFFLFFGGLKPEKWSGKKLTVCVLLFCLPLLFSYNALSHDVFNYIFNAKIVTVYQSNPHIKTALNFPQDEWIRFMHNVHTPAPYGYMWTGISLIPSLLGMGKFTVTWLLFRAFNLLGIVGLIVSFYVLVKTELSKNQYLQKSMLLVLLNPLFLIELVSNSHNDVWMMAPAMLSVGLLRSSKELQLKSLFFSLLLLAFSISIKLSTVVLIPVWLAILLEQVFQKYQLPSMIRRITLFIHQHYADISVLLLFIPLLTPRSQQFHPWYLVWLLVWIPFLRWQWLRNALLVLSVSSLFRYLPWLLNGGFSDDIIFQQKLITFLPLIIYFFSLLVMRFKRT